MTTQLKKIDIILSLTIGAAAGLLIVVVLKNIIQSVPQVQFIPLWAWPVIFPVFCLAWFLFAFLLSRKLPVFYQIGKFVLVGGLNFLLDLGVLNLLIFLTSIAAGWWYSAFKAAAFIIAVTNSYLFNKFWTFKTGRENAGREILTFLAVSGCGMLINNAAASLIVNVIGPQWEIGVNLWANVGAILAAFISVFWNFIGYKFIVFRK